MRYVTALLLLFSVATVTVVATYQFMKWRYKGDIRRVEWQDLRLPILSFVVGVVGFQVVRILA